MLVLDRTGSMCQDSRGQDQHPTCPDMNNAKDGLRTFLGYFDPNMAHVGFAVLPPAVDPSRPCDAPGGYNSTGYELVPLSSDFRNADGSLNTRSNLVSTINCVQSNGSTAYANSR